MLLYGFLHSDGHVKWAWTNIKWDKKKKRIKFKKLKIRYCGLVYGQRDRGMLISLKSVLDEFGFENVKLRWKNTSSSRISRLRIPSTKKNNSLILDALNYMKIERPDLPVLGKLELLHDMLTHSNKISCCKFTPRLKSFFEFIGQDNLEDPLVCVVAQYVYQA